MLIEPVATHVRELLGAIKSSNPSGFVPPTAALAQAAHALVVLADEAAGDDGFEHFKRTDIASSSAEVRPFFCFCEA
mgnify:FL=1